jgi:GntR family transcriptional regulator, rspAB operon transcriptional repressor
MPKGLVSLEENRPTDIPCTEGGLAARAYAVIRERIVCGEYLLGQVISRRRIAADLGISFLPASEALLRLECEGLLESRPRAGTRIRIPTWHHMQGHLVVRGALQVQAAMMFAQHATPEERAELMDLAFSLDSEGTSHGTDPRERLTLHERLHQKIAEYTHCEALNEEMRKHSALVSAWLCTMRSTIPADAHLKHEPLIKALTQRNSEAAAETMRAHVHAEMENTLRALEASFETNKKYMHAYSRTIGGKSPKPVAEMALGMESIDVNIATAHSPAVRVRA